jgi:nicotinate phosphoribosyltransferase
LRSFQFTGDIYAMPEGTIFFPNEPMLEVTAPIIEAQIIETLALNTIGFQTLVTTKATRCVTAAAGRSLLDFSLRRTQGRDSGMKVARNTYIAGFDATSNVLAGKQYGIPVSGTMAHSFIMSFDNEPDAFKAFAKIFPKNAVFLIDTYNTEEGARHAAQVASEMKKEGHQLIGVRLDSGNMADLSIKVRHILDRAGHKEVKILASSSFDEYKISNVLSAGGEIDGFGVGTKLGVSADAPYCDIVYKLVRFDGRDVRKLSPEKVTLAGTKQVFRTYDARGYFIEDLIGLRNEVVVGTTSLLENIMTSGKPARLHPSLQSLREEMKNNLSHLDEKYKGLQAAATYPVSLSNRLKSLQTATTYQHQGS